VGVVAASGGNAGIAVACAGSHQNVPARVYVPEVVPEVKAALLRAYGAEVVRSGSRYAEDYEAAVNYAADVGALSVHRGHPERRARRGRPGRRRRLRHRGRFPRRHRIGDIAYAVAERTGVRSLLVDDPDITAARKLLWDRYRLAVEPGGATALAVLLTGAYQPREGERIAAVLCGANTDPATLT
jgi:threonine dehydratase